MVKRKNVSEIYRGNMELIQRMELENSSIRKGIKKGWLTLDSDILNFCVVYTGSNSEVISRFCDLDYRLRSSEGAEVLIVRKKTTEAGSRYKRCIFGLDSGSSHSFLPEQPDYKVELNLDLGILSGKGLDFDLDKRDIIFRTRRGVNIVGESSHSFLNLDENSLSRVRGRIRIPAEDLPHLYMKPGNTSWITEGNGFSSEVLIGDEVPNYLEGECSEEIKVNFLEESKEVYKKARKMLGLIK